MRDKSDRHQVIAHVNRLIRNGDLAGALPFLKRAAAESERYRDRERLTLERLDEICEVNGRLRDEKASMYRLAHTEPLVGLSS